jgi:hypothetical protein
VAVAVTQARRELSAQHTRHIHAEIHALVYQLYGLTEEETDKGDSRPGASPQGRGWRGPAPFPSTTEYSNHVLVFIASGKCVKNGHR